MKAWAASLLLAAASPTMLAAPSVPDCSGTYPPSLVTQTVEDPKYKQCNVVVQGYSTYVGQQLALLRKLRPAYERELVAKEDKGDEHQARKMTRQRLEAFDQALERVAVANTPPKIELAASAAGSAPARATARQWLQSTKADRQRLSDRINDVASAFKGDELAAFCQGDFFARVSTELEKKLAACLRE